MNTPKAKPVRISLGNTTLEGDLTLPEDAGGIVLFAHGSGSSRLSPRNKYVAKELNSVGLATLLMDLLTQKDEEIDALTGQLRFDITLLANRLIDATEWLKDNSSTTPLAVGYFGASTGTAAALVSAAQLPDYVHAVVSRGGRTDLEMRYLSRVKEPVLFIAGANDEIVVKLNNEAMKHLQTEKRLEIVTGASNLFEEPGALEKVAELAANWFLNYLQRK